MSTRRPILISGAGLASLLLGQSLRRSAIPFRVYERDASLAFRGQGYRLRLSNEGLDAIESVLGPEDFARFYDKCGKTGGAGFTDLDAITGEPIDGTTGGNINREQLTSRDSKTVGIARGEMRQLFFEGLEDHVEFQKQVTGYELVDGGVRAVFADGTKSEVGDMLVGGEGIKSRVAKQVSGGKLVVYDTGARGIHGQAPTGAFKGLNEGVFMISDRSKDKDSRVGIITNVRPNDIDNPDVEYGWTMVGPPGLIRAPNDDYSIVGNTAADLAKKLTADWHEKYRPLFEQMNTKEAAFWKITCSTPSGVPEWPNEPRVTVIGDAAHSMTPAGGIGANTAVRDSALLGRLLKEANGWNEGVTAEYEKRMRVYGSEAVAKSYSLGTEGFRIKIVEGETPTVSV
jgi:2-polyprenyl-6-methoxyphenol hydroxylase-like FAD-dependent oxidoreductase